jgi:4-amino-4-deoxy-L-arabinose transferase-like glycosyltransferase
MAEPESNHPPTPEPQPDLAAMAYAPEARRQSAWVGVVVLALVLRIAWAAIVPMVPISDCAAYDTFARNLAAHNVFGFEATKPTAFWPPGTSFVYSLIYRVLDPATYGYTPVIAFNVLLGVASVLLAGLLARRWFGERVGLVTALLMAIWPMHIEFSTILSSEQMFTGLCLGAMLAWPGQRQIAPVRLVLVAVLFAGATYMRTTALLIPFILIGIDFLRTLSVPVALIRGVTIALVMLACIAPWTKRNYDLFGKFVPIAANSGSNFWMGNNPNSKGEYQDLPEFPGLNEAERDAKLKQEAWAYIKQDPGAFAKRTIIKAGRLYERETIGIAWNQEGLKRIGASDRAIKALKLASEAFWIAILATGVIGAVLLLRRGFFNAILHPTIVLVAYYTAVHAVVVIQDRYHFPVTPMIGALAALALTHLGQYFVSRKQPGANAA